MSAIPTVEMVKECLEKYYAKKGRTPPSPLLPEVANKAISSDCNYHLMAGWEQCLDIKTGEIYFINQKTGIRIDNQPRNTPGRSYYLWKSSGDHSDNSSVETESNDNNIKIYTQNNGKLSASGVLPPRPRGETAKTKSLEVVVCNGCCTNMMIAEETKACPRCGDTLVSFTNERCF